MNYNLVIDTSNFKPFDINPALQVLHDYRDAYYRLEDLINKIAEEKGEYVLPESSKYRGVMDRYNSDFDTAAADFFNLGMNLRNASAIRNLRRRYSSEITPIRTMVENYNKYNDKLTALGPDAIIGNVYSVDDFYGGVNPLIDYRSAKQVELDSTKYFSGINSALTQDPEFKRILGGQYFQQVQRGGLDSGAALLAALVEYNNRTNGRHSEAVLNLLDHMQNVMNALGVESFSDEAKQRVWNRVAAGLINSIEAPRYSLMQNREYLDKATRLRMAKQDALNDKLLERSGYIWNSATKEYEYKPELVQRQPVTILNITYNWSEGEKKWVSTDGRRLTDSELNRIYNSNSPIGEYQRNDEGNFYNTEAYYDLGTKFEPFEFKMDDYDTDDESELGVRASTGFKRLSEGGAGFNGATSGEEYRGIGLDVAQIPVSTKLLILEEARKQIPDLQYQDLVLYIDKDNWSDDHIRVCIKNTGENGNYLGSGYHSSRTTVRDYPPPAANTTIVGDTTSRIQLPIAPDTVTRDVTPIM